MGAATSNNSAETFEEVTQTAPGQTQTQPADQFDLDDEWSTTPGGAHMLLDDEYQTQQPTHDVPAGFSRVSTHNCAPALAKEPSESLLTDSGEDTVMAETDSIEERFARLRGDSPAVIFHRSSFLSLPAPVPPRRSSRSSQTEWHLEADRQSVRSNVTPQTHGLPQYMSVSANLDTTVRASSEEIPDGWRVASTFPISQSQRLDNMRQIMKAIQSLQGLHREDSFSEEVLQTATAAWSMLSHRSYRNEGLSRGSRPHAGAKASISRQTPAADPENPSATTNATRRKLKRKAQNGDADASRPRKKAKEDSTTEKQHQASIPVPGSGQRRLKGIWRKGGWRTMLKEPFA